VVGLDDVESGVIAGLFGALIYLFPFFTGAVADRMGFRNGLMLAFALLTVGYGTLGVFSTLGPVLVGLFLIVIGGAFGLGREILERSSLKLSLSPMTLPHEIARLILAEQLYRALTILRGLPYHK